MSTNLCQLCQEIDLHKLGAFHGSCVLDDGITRSRDELRDDCSLCRLFIGAVSRDVDYQPEREIEKITIRADPGVVATSAHFSGRARLWLRRAKREILSRLQGPQYYPISSILVSTYYKWDEDSYPIPVALDVFLDDDSSEETKKHACGRTVSPADSDASVARVAGWLNNCIKQHPYCRLGLSNRRYDDKPSTTPLPDRVIAVGSAAEAPRLVETNRKCGLYVALSYCWEPNPPGQYPFRLEKGNRSELKKGIPLSSLPPTIQDAIDFTRRLGIYYIWIDRLCIIQDDVKDVNIHVAQMCDIYERASLTIAALGASAQGEGLYLPRQPRASVRIKCATPSKDLGYMHVTLSRLEADLADSDAERQMTSFGQELSLSRWNTRGWVLQERAMSRRIVYFGRWQLFWECQEQTLVEDGIRDGSDVFGQLGKGNSRPKHYFRDELAAYRRKERLHHWLPWLVDPSPMHFWNGVVKDYTSRQLTFETDKGKAVAGIGEATRSALSLSGGYAWGIFLPYADQLLLWHWEESHLTAPEVPRGPSWSWISYDGRVRQLEHDWPSTMGACAFLKHDEVRALGITISKEIPEPAVLSIRGARIVAMAWRDTSAYQVGQLEAWLGQAMEIFDPGALGDEVELYLPKLIRPKITQQGIECASHRFVLSMDDTGTICGFVQFDLKDHRPPSTRIHCLIAGETTEPMPSGPVWRRSRQAAAIRKVYHILALEQVSAQSTAKVPVYRRLGIAQTVWVRHADFGSPIRERATRFEEVAII